MSCVSVHYELKIENNKTFLLFDIFVKFNDPTHDFFSYVIKKSKLYVAFRDFVCPMLQSIDLILQPNVAAVWCQESTVACEYLG